VGCAAIDHDRADQGDRGAPTRKEETQVTIKKIVAWLVLLFIIFFILTQPATAASLLRSVGNGIADAVSALAAFFQSLV
jgi:hypothetical protein